MSGRELDPDGTDSYHPEHPWEQVGHPAYLPRSERTRSNWPPVPATPAGSYEHEQWASLPYTAEVKHQTVFVDGEPVRVQGHIEPENLEAFADLIRAVKEKARSIPPTACGSPRCHHEPSHFHGPLCTPSCLCGKGIEPTVCGCGHRLAIHEYPMMCRGAFAGQDDQAPCDCHRNIEFDKISADRTLLKAEQS
jgi:hypothetical protein